MLATNGLYSVVKEVCGVAYEDTFVSEDNCRMLYLRSVSVGDHLNHTFWRMDPISLDIWWYYGNVFVVRKLPLYSIGTVFCEATALLQQVESDIAVDNMGHF
jgi:hypothetical protein